MLHGENIAVGHGLILAFDFQDDLGVDQAQAFGQAGHHDRAFEAADAEIAHVVRVKRKRVLLAVRRHQGRQHRAGSQPLSVGITKIQGNAQLAAAQGAGLYIAHLT